MKFVFKLILAAAVAATALIGLTVGTASAYPCAGKGGAVFAQSSGVGPEASVEIQCGDGTWELY